MKKFVLLILIVCGLLYPDRYLLGQRNRSSVNFWPVEDSIQKLFKAIRETKDDSAAVRWHYDIETILARTLESPDAYRYKFDSLKTIGKIYAPRKKFRIFNWNHSFRDGTNRHFAIIVIPVKKKDSKVIRLYDMSDSIKRPEQQTLGPDQWFGALYYSIIPARKSKGKRYYTLLGLDMNNLQTKKKLIEILSFSGDVPQFGAPIIEMNGWIKKRAIFEFSIQHNMYLEYHRFRRIIELDHLAPLMPYLVGEYEYYEPDMYRDGLKFRKGRWKHYKEIKKPPRKIKVKKRNLPKPPKPKPPKSTQPKEKQVDGNEEQQPEEVIDTN